MELDFRFCVYLTIYSGNLLPPFYIGYSQVLKVERGYRGSVSSKEYRKLWKSENESLFKTKILKTFRTRQEAFQYEKKLIALLNAHKNPLYVNRALYPNLGKPFIKRHQIHVGRKRSLETRRKLSQSLTGKRWSEERKRAFSESTKGRVPWNKGKKTGQKVWNKGKTKAEDSRLCHAHWDHGKDLRGKTYEQIYGPEKAAELKLQRSEKMKETRARMKSL